MRFWNRTIRDRVAAVVFGTLVVVTAVGVTWTLRQAYAVYRLTRGVGSRAIAEAIIAADPLLAGVAGDAPLGTPGWRLTFADAGSFEAFLVAFDSRE